MEKYCLDNNILEWIRTTEKTFKNGSIGWKIGDGKKVRIREDPWMGVGENYKLSMHLIQSLKTYRIFTIVDAYKDLHMRGRS